MIVHILFFTNEPIFDYFLKHVLRNDKIAQNILWCTRSILCNIVLIVDFKQYWLAETRRIVNPLHRRFLKHALSVKPLRKFARQISNLNILQAAAEEVVIIVNSSENWLRLTRLQLIDIKLSAFMQLHAYICQRHLFTYYIITLISILISIYPVLHRYIKLKY